MRNIHPYAFVLVLLLFASCKKEESELWTEVHVSATNFNSGEPLNDVFISILQNNDGLFGGNSKAISESFTDENGEFHFEWKAKRNSGVDYQCITQANPAKYYQIEFKQIEFLTKGNTHNFEVKLVEVGALNMNFHNVNCLNENDQLHYRYYFKKSPAANDYVYIYAYHWENSSKNGCIYQVGDGGYQTLPAGTYTVEWNVTRDNGYTEGSDTFFVPDGDSLTYLLEY